MALVEITPTHTYDLTASDRPFAEEEEIAEQEAIKFPINIYKRIKPVHGTLGYAFRNIKGRNYVVIEALRNAGEGSRAKFIKNFIIIWNNLDVYSRNRVDIFDWLCEKYDVPKPMFFGYVQQGMYKFNDLMAQTAISGYTTEFIELVKKLTKTEKNIRDRELFAKMSGLTKDAPLIGSIQNNSTKNELHVHGNSPLPSFAQAMRKSDEGIRTLPQSQPQKALSEGIPDYIDAELITHSEEAELEDFHKRAEEEFIKAAKELS